MTIGFKPRLWSSRHVRARESREGPGSTGDKVNGGEIREIHLSHTDHFSSHFDHCEARGLRLLEQAAEGREILVGGVERSVYLLQKSVERRRIYCSSVGRKAPPPPLPRASRGREEGKGCASAHLYSRAPQYHSQHLLSPVVTVGAGRSKVSRITCRAHPPSDSQAVEVSEGWCW